MSASRRTGGTHVPSPLDSPEQSPHHPVSEVPVTNAAPDGNSAEETFVNAHPPNEREDVRRQHGEGKPQISPREARQAKKVGHMRWVVRISIALAAIGLVIAWLAA